MSRSPPPAPTAGRAAAVPGAAAGPALDSHTHLDIVLGERPAGTSTASGRRTTTSTPRSPPRSRSTSRGWCRSASTSRRPGGRRRSPPGTRTCWPPSRCTPTRPAPGRPPTTRSPRSTGWPALPRVRAVGETGLDRYRTGPEGWAAQEASFRAHIRIAKEHGVALVIHDRDAHDEILARARRRGRPRAHGLPLLLRRRRVREGLRRARASCCPSPAP